MARSAITRDGFGDAISDATSGKSTPAEIAGFPVSTLVIFGVVAAVLGFFWWKTGKKN